MCSIMYHSSCELLSVKVDKSGALKIRKKENNVMWKVPLHFFILFCTYGRVCVS